MYKFLFQAGEKGFRRLTQDQPVGLRHCGFIIKVQEIVKTSSGEIDHIKATCEPVSSANKPKAFIHWVSKPVNIEVRLYDRL